MSALGIHDALVHVMVLMSAADRDMGDGELARIGTIIRTLPVFEGFDEERTIAVAKACQEALQAPDGFAATLEAIRDALPRRLRDTAYALAVDVASIDLDIKDEEDRMLDILKARFGIDPLAAAAIERAAAIRHRVPDGAEDEDQ